MIDGGCDPRYGIARRAIRMASEDVGNADPRALTLTLDAADSYERLGSPRGRIGVGAGARVSGMRAKKQRCIQRL